MLAGGGTWSGEAGEGYDVGWIEVLLDQRQTHQGGNPARWPAAGLVDLLLRVFPEEIIVSDDDLEDVVPRLRSFISFLADTERLAPGSDSIDDLLEALDAIEDAFLKAMGAAGGGLADQLFRAMAAEGVNLADEGAIEAWLASFNNRSQEERRAVVGPAIMATGPGTPVRVASRP